MPIFDQKWPKIGSPTHKIAIFAISGFFSAGLSGEKWPKTDFYENREKWPKMAIFLGGGGVEMRSISLTHRNYFRNPKNDAFLDILH